MKTMPQRIFVVLMMICVFSFAGCQKANEKADPVLFSPGKEYTVGLKVDSFETKGLLSFEENGALRFLHSDPNSPLFGMEEVTKKGLCTVHFQNITWESDQIIPATARLWEVIEQIRTKSQTEVENDSIREQDCTRYEFSDDDFTVHFWINSATHTPVCIKAQWEGHFLEINFAYKA